MQLCEFERIVRMLSQNAMLNDDDVVELENGERKASRVIESHSGRPAVLGHINRKTWVHGDVGFDVGCGPEEDIDLRRAEHERRNRGNPCCSLPTAWSGGERMGGGGCRLTFG
ncbi:hypothetical protein CEXT_519601 [Caerostris extrusa]|uniref:Uncharacterized protein n=1 Tax=Caerostris extrusa TaxID=172846 RepID=A0AAV4TQ57_CAEEX|nr:hypothetical protein CEXT_519601 [Caerostris extrusa]